MFHVQKYNVEQQMLGTENKEVLWDPEVFGWLLVEVECSFIMGIRESFIYFILGL